MKKGEKKSSKKGSKKTKNDEKLAEQIKELSFKYLAFCKQFASAPLPQILVRIKKSADNSAKCDRIILSSAELNSSDISSISEAFRTYDQLAFIAVWNSPTPFHIIRLLVRVNILFSRVNCICPTQLSKQFN